MIELNINTRMIDYDCIMLRLNENDDWLFFNGFTVDYNSYGFNKLILYGCRWTMPYIENIVDCYSYPMNLDCLCFVKKECDQSLLVVEKHRNNNVRTLEFRTKYLTKEGRVGNLCIYFKTDTVNIKNVNVYYAS